MALFDTTHLDRIAMVERESFVHVGDIQVIPMGDLFSSHVFVLDKFVDEPNGDATCPECEVRCGCQTLLTALSYG